MLASLVRNPFVILISSVSRVMDRPPVVESHPVVESGRSFGPTGVAQSPRGKGPANAHVLAEVQVFMFGHGPVLIRPSLQALTNEAREIRDMLGDLLRLVVEVDGGDFHCFTHTAFLNIR